MNIFIYSDESGVFDKIHNDYFVFGGVLFLSKCDKENAERKYLAAERVIYQTESIPLGNEIKASKISNKSKGKLYRSLNQFHRFGVVIRQKRIHDEIQSNPKTKQRYLDYAFKIAIKRKFCSLMKQGIIDPEQVENLYFFVDEHSTATNGRYELQEGMEQEFKHGTFNTNYSIYYEPIFPNLKRIEVKFCDSKAKTLVRAADIVANKIYHSAIEEAIAALSSDLFYLIELP